MAEAPIKITVSRFKCAHCARSWAKKSGAERHIPRCAKNPEYRGCRTCACFQPAERGDYSTGYPGCAESCDAGASLDEGLAGCCEAWASRKIDRALSAFASDVSPATKGP